MCLLLATNCREDTITVSEDDTALPDNENVKFQFQISNEAGEPISNAQIIMNSDVYTSDENGIVLTQSYTINSLGVKSEIIAVGYETLVKRVNGQKDGIITEKVILFKAQNSVVSTGATGLIDGGGSLTLPSNLIALDGSLYAGEVTVRSKYLNPDNKDFLLSAPGNLLALNSTNEYQQLATLGMYMIELYDVNGGVLKIPDGSSATIEFPIAETNKDAIGSEVPLWYFDEDKGVWMEDGVAKVVGEKMVAEVNHFTWWNCDLPYDFITKCVTFLDNDGNPIPNTDIGFLVDGFALGQATTDANGNILVKIPIGVEIQVVLLIDGLVGPVIIAGPYENNDRKEFITLDLNFNIISGVALDCDENLILQGYAYYINNNKQINIPLDVDGSFSYVAPQVEHILTLVNMDDERFTEILITAENQNENLDLQNISVCDQQYSSKASGYVMIDTDGDNIGDTALSGAQGRFINIGGTHKTFTTDDNGYYEVAVPSNTNFFIFLTTAGYVPIASGDKTPEGNVENEEFAIGNFDLSVDVPEDEHDTNNDFLMIEEGEGIISGTAFGDSDGDGMGDTPLEWSTLRISQSSTSVIDNSLVSADGTFSFDYETGYRDWRFWHGLGSSFFIVDWDTSPDPDGDDISLGNNGIIPTVLHDGEVDADNKFVIRLQSNYWLLCRVLEDTDMDGIGDNAIEGVNVNVKYRDSGELKESKTSDANGIINIKKDWSDPDYLELTVEIESSEYEVINIIDTSPDNDPFIVGGNVSKMEIDLEIGEWDAGNIFIVRKI